MKKNSFETQILHTPFEKEDAYHSLSMPVYHTAAYEFETAEEMEAAFCGQKAGHAYSRITNPTVQYFEQRVQRVTGVQSCNTQRYRSAECDSFELRDGCDKQCFDHTGKRGS